MSGGTIPQPSVAPPKLMLFVGVRRPESRGAGNGSGLLASDPVLGSAARFAALSAFRSRYCRGGMPWSVPLLALAGWGASCAAISGRAPRVSCFGEPEVAIDAWGLAIC